MLLLDLPIELLQEIIDNVRHPNDLVALGSACEALASLTIPFPADYRFLLWPTYAVDRDWILPPPQLGRIIPANPGDLSTLFLRHLLEEPKRAKAVHQLEVRGGIAVPPLCLDIDTIEAAIAPATGNGDQTPEWHRTAFASVQAHIAEALKRMPTLHVFSWRWNDPDVDSPLWDSLSRVNTLRSLHFNLSDDGIPRGHDNFGTAPDAQLSRIASVAQGLELLELLWIEVDFSIFAHNETVYRPFWNASSFLRSRYTSLRALFLTRARGHPADVATFFSAHPKLDNLRLESHAFDFSRASVDALPNLTCLDMQQGRADLAIAQYPDLMNDITLEACGGMGFHFLSPLNSGTLRPIISLTISPASNEELSGLHTFLPNLAGSLQELLIIRWYPAAAFKEEDVDWMLLALPYLVELGIPGNAVKEVVDDHGPIFHRQNIPRIRKWANYFLLAPRLTKLSLTCRGYRVSPSCSGTHSLVNIEDVFCDVSPTLRVVEMEFLDVEPPARSRTSFDIICERVEVVDT